MNVVIFSYKGSYSHSWTTNSVLACLEGSEYGLRRLLIYLKVLKMEHCS